MWVLELFDWLSTNWKWLIQVGLILFLFTLIKPIKTFIKSALEGIKESIDPLGFFVLLVLVLLFFAIKGMF